MIFCQIRSLKAISSGEHLNNMSYFRGQISVSRAVGLETPLVPLQLSVYV